MTLEKNKREINSLLKKLYYDPVTGYTGVDPLVAATAVAGKKKIKRQVVTEWLAKQEPYALHKPVSEKFKRNKTLTKGIDYIWQSDLIDIQPLARQNSGFRYMLVAIDTFSRYAWVEPLKRKTGLEVVRGFKQILKSGRKPKKICTDMGKEYLNREVQQFLTQQGIIHYSLASDTKASIAERFNRTLKDRMWRYIMANNTRRYVNVLSKLVEGYNQRKHRVLGVAPASVSKKNEQTLWKKQFDGEIPTEKKRKKPKFKVGQQVRLSNKKSIFAKGYTGNWTREIFTIGSVRTNQKQPLYDILDPKDGQPIKGGFYEQQLQLVSE